MVLGIAWTCRRVCYNSCFKIDSCIFSLKFINFPEKYLEWSGSNVWNMKTVNITAISHWVLGKNTNVAQISSTKNVIALHYVIFKCIAYYASKYYFSETIFVKVYQNCLTTSKSVRIVRIVWQPRNQSEILGLPVGCFGVRISWQTRLFQNISEFYFWNAQVI